MYYHLIPGIPNKSVASYQAKKQGSIETNSNSSPESIYSYFCSVFVKLSRVHPKTDAKK